MNVDFLEAGSSGPLVVLVHSSVFGARQWRRLIEDLQTRFRVRAINLYGYGKTPPWSPTARQTLADQASLVEAVVPDDANNVYLVGHSFGGSVAMKAAIRLGDRVDKLVLIEPNPIFLLKENGRHDLFDEAMRLAHDVKTFGARNQWAAAAERFADYWGGAGSWERMSPERRAAFCEGLKPNVYEWDVANESLSIREMATRLPPNTLVTYDPETVAPIREIVAILQEACPWWTFTPTLNTGHMAPLTHPEVVNPIVGAFLEW